MSSKRLSNTSGFTLIEVVIVMVILTFISIGIYQMTYNTFKLRDELAAEGEFYNAIRMSMDVVQRDVSSMFSPIISRPDPAPTPTANPGNAYGGGYPQQPAVSPDMQAVLNSDMGKATTFWLGATDKTALRPSRFIGSPNKFTFVSSSHVRIYKDATDSDFARITYELVNDEQNKNNTKDYGSDPKALMRIENTAAFDDDERKTEKFGRRYIILRGIKSMSFRYWRKDKDNGLGKWETTWDNDKEDFREKYPDIVEITLEVSGPMHLSFTGRYQFRPEVPLRGLDPST